MIRNKIFWALLGAIGGVASLAFSATARKYVFPQGSSVLWIGLDFVAFSILGWFILYSLTFSPPFAKLSFWRVILGGLLVGALAGPVFPWGTIGYFLSFLLMAVLLSLFLDGLSVPAVRSIFFSLVGALVGWIGSLLWLIPLGLLKPELLNVEPLAAWIPFGFACYSFTLGLHLSK